MGENKLIQKKLLQITQISINFKALSNNYKMEKVIATKIKINN